MDSSNLSSWIARGLHGTAVFGYVLAVYLWTVHFVLEIWHHRTTASDIPRPRMYRFGETTPQWSYVRMLQGIVLVLTALAWFAWLYPLFNWTMRIVTGALLFYAIPVLSAALGQWWGHHTTPWAGWIWRPAVWVLRLESVILEPLILIERAWKPASTAESAAQLPATAPSTTPTFVPETVEDIVQPRTDVHAFAVDTPLDTVLTWMVRSQQPWAIVYETAPERWAGFVRWHRVVAAFRTRPNGTLRDVVWERPLEVPEGQRLQTLWEQWTTPAIPLAFVYDEYGELLGLVTWSSVASALLQRLTDVPASSEEYAEYYRVEPDGSWIVHGRCPIELFWQLVGLAPDQKPGDFETVAGWVGSLVPHLPRPGERIYWNGLEMTVLEVGPRRLEKIRARRLPDDAAPNPSHPSEAVYSHVS